MLIYAQRMGRIDTESAVQWGLPNIARPITIP